jgi:hypothetical protein
LNPVSDGCVYTGIAPAVREAVRGYVEDTDDDW